MKLKFPPFQRFIQLRVVPKIVSRANDSVVKSLDVSDTTITAQVRGSKLYNVEIVFDQEEVVKASCNCPYDYSGYCKHIVWETALKVFYQKNGLPSLSDILETAKSKTEISVYTKVIATRLITPGTIEEKIMELQQRKKQLAQDLIRTDDQVFKRLTKDELIGIL